MGSERIAMAKTKLTFSPSLLAIVVAFNNFGVRVEAAKDDLKGLMSDS
jgi:hypothetical protein